jgi:ATP-binding cassette subfamily F protein 3
LIGPNGCGKTTLLRILAGQEKPDSGGFHFSPSDLRVAYLEQGMSPLPDETMDSFLGGMAGDRGKLTARLERLAPVLAQDPQRPGLQRLYDDLLAQIEAATQNASRKPQTLAALGLGDIPPDTPASHMSGGQKTRLALAGVLLASPQLLLLDEPTNHLDLEMLEWLEDWLVNSPASRRTAALIVSHDRAFLDQTVTGILEIDPLAHTLKAYAGNYSDYLEHKLAERERHWQEYADQQEEIARLRSAALHMRGIARFKRGGKADGGDKFAKGFFANRGKGTIARAKHIERRLEQLLTEERIDKPAQTWQMKAGFFEQDFIQTSLVRTNIGLLPPLAGKVRLGAGVKLGYMAQEQETLDPSLDALTTIRMLAPLSETAARHFLHQFLFTGDEVFTPVGRLSYGERARLYLAGLVAQGHNFLLLDEPINHLDIPSRARFEGALATFEGTVLAVVHDRYFIEGFASKIWEIRDGRLSVLL